jgi:hypothetical protein
MNQSCAKRGLSLTEQSINYYRIGNVSDSLAPDKLLTQAMILLCERI